MILKTSNEIDNLLEISIPFSYGPQSLEVGERPMILPESKFLQLSSVIFKLQRYSKYLKEDSLSARKGRRQAYSFAYVR